jgi:5-methylcytosine-specific restriction endonuclease McrA
MSKWAKLDKLATQAARECGEFICRKSWYGIRSDGSQFKRLHGADKVGQRERLFALWNGLCSGCGLPVARGDEDMDHTVPLSKGGDDSDANMNFRHGMWSKHRCHRAKHNREPRLSTWPKVIGAKI